MAEPTIVDLDDWGHGFVTSLVPQLRAAFRRLVEGLPPDAVVGLGVYTDSDATSIMAAANTRANLDRLGARYPDDRETFRWSTGEWDRTTVDVVERGGPDDLAAATAEAERAAEAVLSGDAPGEDHQSFRFTVWEAIVTAMSVLFDDGFFDPWPVAIQVFDVPDFGLDPATVIDWTAEMNTDAAAADFERWVQMRLSRAYHPLHTPHTISGLTASAIFPGIIDYRRPRENRSALFIDQFKLNRRGYILNILITLTYFEVGKCRSTARAILHRFEAFFNKVLVIQFFKRPPH